MNKALADRVIAIDPFMERSIKCKRALQAAMLPYNETYWDMQTKANQSTGTSFLIRVDSITTATTTSTSSQ